ncbi:PREDICTED: uncharacterized protein LOC105971574 [Erythranthe guttata]|uniref:uncharacterized protein LOC105971574 n=1 Tax=Erythranthe guttata TaxID=4155 RepID=UPI00064D798D|nr:PREDICTED: uncharacterized protein LOC105971574 [Erythranthe guttata]|eukprot:XP_012851880.1 PREDICTED: uncharacterized protein LOC105971574 [Erythranthe guttata]
MIATPPRSVRARLLSPNPLLSSPLASSSSALGDDVPDSVERKKRLRSVLTCWLHLLWSLLLLRLLPLFSATTTWVPIIFSTIFLIRLLFVSSFNSFCCPFFVNGCNAI